MALRFHVNLTDDRQAQKTEIVEDDLAAAGVPAGSIMVAIGDGVPRHRQMEILSGWRKLWAGIRDRNLLDPGLTNGGSGPLYTAFSIDSRTENNRRTSWSDIAIFLNPDDVLVGVHNSLASSEAEGGVGAVNMVENGFRMLEDFAKESNVLA